MLYEKKKKNPFIFFTHLLASSTRVISIVIITITIIINCNDTNKMILLDTVLQYIYEEKYLKIILLKKKVEIEIKKLFT